jgi:CHAT domain-containing protein
VEKTDELLLGVGNPSFDHQAFPLESLPASEREVTEIKSFYPRSTVLIGRDAREESVQSQLGKVDVLHLASHYVVDEQSPLQSKLLMAQEPAGAKRGQAQDGVLQAEEIYRKRPLSARLVVLSACRSGVERYYRGEGMIGMSRAFLAAGVPLVSASLWPVDSEATSRLMIRFHKHRKTDGFQPPRRSEERSWK